MFYFVKTPWLLKKIYPHGIWDLPSTESNKVYLSFDDGPHPSITPFVLEQLKLFNAKATFFCIGKNVQEHPATYHEILAQGHCVGNHTQNHLNGWKTDNQHYLTNIKEASKYIDSNLFRPPYGRIRKEQASLIHTAFPAMKIIMWNILSADFDTTIDDKKCTDNVLSNTTNGSIIVFHDSEKAFPRLKNSLPVVLRELSEKGFQFEVIR